MSISKKRLDSMLATLNDAVRSVYASVPIEQSWDAWAIHNDLIRTGKARDLNGTKGCLDKLVKMGIVNEPKRGEFVREKVRVDRSVDFDIEFDEDADETTATAATTGGEKLSTIEKLDRLGATLKALSDSIKAVAIDVENIAIEVDDSLKSKDAESEKLHQLKALLKSLG